MPSVSFECNSCHKPVVAEYAQGRDILCPSCGTTRVASLKEGFFEICPLCSCRQFYIQKDFNRAAGCLIMLCGIILVPFTYGLSLPLFAFFDWLLYRRISTMIICYACGAEFRGFAVPPNFKEFLHPIGEKYERKKEKEGKRA